MSVQAFPGLRPLMRSSMSASGTLLPSCQTRGGGVQGVTGWVGFKTSTSSRSRPRQQEELHSYRSEQACTAGCCDPSRGLWDIITQCPSELRRSETRQFNSRRSRLGPHQDQGGEHTYRRAPSDRLHHAATVSPSSLRLLLHKSCCT